MSWWSRLANVVRRDHVISEIDEELHAHLEEAIAHGRDPSEARRALGSALRYREESLHVKALPWVDAVRADIVFGWRRLMKTKTTSFAAILSLALAIGACTSAFRLIDALLLRPLPIAGADRLYALSRRGVGPDGKPASFDGWAFPAFRLMRASVRDQAELIAVSYAERADVSYTSGDEIERPFVQYVSGWMFGTFGLRPASGRLLGEADDRQPHAHPYAVLSHDYWTRRFGRDPHVVGRTFSLGADVFEIVGVAEDTFTGTETGTVTDIFLPTMMDPRVERSDATWIRAFARLEDDAGVEPVRARLHATSRAFEEERAKGFTGMSKASIERFLDQTLALEPAAAGASGLQQDYGRSLVALAVLIALVLLIASANVANLMTAQASARTREMALRVSIGAGRGRLVQLVLVEGAVLALGAAALGALFAWWATPFVVSHINPPDNPVRLSLPTDWRVLGFSVTLTVIVTMLFGLSSALRASRVGQAGALKSGADVPSRRRVMHGVIAAQTAFCFLVVFAGSLFVVSFERLSTRPLGFSADRLLVLDAVPASPQAPIVWEEVAEHLRTVAGVESVALTGWPLLSRNSWNGFVSIEGAPPGPVLAYFLSVSPGWMRTMKVPLINGRDFQPHETSPGVALVNETFVRQFFEGVNPIGRTFSKGPDRYRIVGVVGDAPYRSVREPVPPAAYVPFRGIDLTPSARAAFVVRTVGSPLALAPVLRQEMTRARREFRVSNIRTQVEINEAQTVRDRLLAMLALFFTTVAVVLAGVGLYGVLEYSVLQLRRDIGIRLALGAGASHVARRVALRTVSMVAIGALMGLALSLVLARYVQTLLYGVSATDTRMVVLPALAVFSIALLAAAVPVIRASRTDPALVLRAD
jgi:putative ABC transport system permease protein